jgi:hypothetical protein
MTSKILAIANPKKEFPFFFLGSRHAFCVFLILHEHNFLELDKHSILQIKKINGKKSSLHNGREVKRW